MRARSNAISPMVDLLMQLLDCRRGATSGGERLCEMRIAMGQSSLATNQLGEDPNSTMLNSCSFDDTISGETVFEELVGTSRALRKVIEQVQTVAPGNATVLLLAGHRWPGNIRELENVIERAVIVSRGSILEVSHRDLCSRIAAGNAADGCQTLEEVERKHIFATLKHAKWVLSGPRGAAKLLGLNRPTLHFRMKKRGIVRSFDADLAPRDNERETVHLDPKKETSQC